MPSFGLLLLLCMKSMVGLCTFMVASVRNVSLWWPSPLQTKACNAQSWRLLISKQSAALSTVQSLLVQCVLHMPKPLPNIRTLAVLSEVFEANSTWSMCRQHGDAVACTLQELRWYFSISWWKGKSTCVQTCAYLQHAQEPVAVWHARHLNRVASSGKHEGPA